MLDEFGNRIRIQPIHLHLRNRIRGTDPNGLARISTWTSGLWWRAAHVPPSALAVSCQEGRLHVVRCEIHKNTLGIE